MSRLIDLRLHAHRMYTLLAELSQLNTNMVQGARAKDWMLAADWLRMAASIDKVILDTTGFDYSVLYCDEAAEYESKRGKLLTDLATKLSVFNFVWGGLEIVISIISPPSVESQLTKRLGRGNGNIDRAIFFLKREFDPMRRVPLYDDILADLRLLLNGHENNFALNKLLKEDEMTSIAGLGLHIVRKIRNRLAHGSIELPIPVDWGEKAPELSSIERSHSDIIEASSRILLLTIQMLILALYKGESLSVSMLETDEGESIEQDLRVVLRVLHLSDYAICEQQMRFLG